MVVRARGSAVAALDLAHDDAGASLALAFVIGRLNRLDVEVGEQLLLVPSQVVGEAEVGRLLNVPVEELPHLAADTGPPGRPGRAAAGRARDA